MGRKGALVGQRCAAMWALPAALESVLHHLHPRLGQSFALGLAQERGWWGHNFLALLERWLPLIKDNPAEKSAEGDESLSQPHRQLFGAGLP